MIFDNYYTAPQSKSVSFMYKVYAWMCAALAVTAITAQLAVSWPPLLQLIMNPGALLVLFIAQIILVVALSFYMRTLSLTTAAGMFFVYAILMGMTISTVFLIYTSSSVYITFAIASGMFGVMALYGAVTKADLTTVGNYAVMALWGIIFSLLVNIFMQSKSFDFLISLAGVAVFVLLSAADSQKISRLGQQLQADREETNKIAVLCALTLYLDVINLFLFLLRFTGKSKD